MSKFDFSDMFGFDLDSLSPAKYNGALLDKPKILGFGLDWLQLFYTQGSLLNRSSEFQEMDFQFLRRDRGTRQFKSVFEVWYKKTTKLGTFATDKHEGVALDSGALILKVENSLLYDSRCLEILTEFEKAFRLSFVAITRADIYIDWYGHYQTDSPETLNRFFDRLYRNEIKGTGKRETIVPTLTDNVVTGFNYGSRTANRFARCYDKTKEMQDVKHKQYIFDMWVNAGYQSSENVMRYEIQLKSKFFKLRGISVDQLFDSSYLLALFNEANKDYFEFVWNTGQTRNDREEPYFLVPFQDIEHFLDVKPARVYVCKPYTKDVGKRSVLIAARTLLRDWINCECVSGYKPFELFLLMNRAGILHYFLRKLDRYIDEFRATASVYMEKEYVAQCFFREMRQYDFQSHLHFGSVLSVSGSQEALKKANEFAQKMF